MSEGTANTQKDREKPMNEPTARDIERSMNVWWRELKDKIKKLTGVKSKLIFIII